MCGGFLHRTIRARILHISFHHDRDWWALVISVIALVGAYPLSLLANLTSPSLKNWWAERSVAAIKARIQQLEKQLEDYEKYKELTEGEDYILRAVEALAMLLLVCILMLAMVLLTIISIAPAAFYDRNATPLMGLALAGMIFGFIVSIVVFGRYSLFRTKRSPADRELLRKALNSLKDTLAQRTTTQ